MKKKMRKVKPIIRAFKRIYKKLSNDQVNIITADILSMILFRHTLYLHHVLGSKSLIKLFDEVGDFENVRRLNEANILS